jgi:hypothetical protein
MDGVCILDTFNSLDARPYLKELAMELAATLDGDS